MNISAPAKVTASPVSTTEILVEVAAPHLSPGVVVYRASVGEKSCQVPSTGSVPFACSIGELPAGKLHAVNAVACLATGACSSVTRGEGFTLPDGRLTFRLCNLNS